MSWFLFLVIFLLSGFIFPRYHPAQTFISLNETKIFDKNEEPLIFTHITDVHLSKKMPERTIKIGQIFKNLRNYKVNAHLFTGDYVHNYGKREFPKVGYQVLEDWEIFKKLVNENFNDQFVIDVAGNHDVWAVVDPLGKGNFFLDYSFLYNRSNIKSERDLFLREMRFFNMSFILYNNYRFPNPHPPYHFYSYPSKNQLDILEEVIERTQNAIILTHYPIDYNWKFKSSKGHSLEEIMQNPNVKIVYAGHLHPHEGTRITYHKQGAVEYVGMSLKDGAFGLITIDNGRHIYNTIKGINNSQKVFITNPIPLEDISSHQIFNCKSTPIRVISYYDKEIDIYVKGDINGKLKLDKIMKNGIFLYSMDFYTEKDGIYEITVFNNDPSIDETYHFSITKKFYIGNTFKGKKSPYAKRQRGYDFLRACYIPIVIILFIILFPYDGLYISSVETWITNDIYTRGGIYYVLFLSFLIVRYRIQKSPKNLRLTLFVLYLIIFIIPMHFYQPIENHYGFSFFLYTYLNGSLKYDRWVLQLSLVYLVGVIFVTTNYVSTLKYKNTWVHKYNFYAIYVCIIGANVVNYRWVGESTIIPFLILNPIYIIIPGYIQYILYKYHRR